MAQRSAALRVALALALIATLVCGCSGRQEAAEGEGIESAGFPSKDPGEPFALEETGTIAVTNDQAYEIQVQREDGGPTHVLTMKKGAVIDPSVDFTVRTYAAEIPAELGSRYVSVGPYALEVHAVDDTGYSFALRPALTIYFTGQEIEVAAQESASLDPLKGNLLVLYKEQRSPQWVPQTSVSVDEDAGAVTVRDVAGAGAWRLAAKKAE